jgi:hypothetical protein
MRTITTYRESGRLFILRDMAIYHHLSKLRPIIIICNWKPLLLSVALWQACLGLAALITVVFGSDVDQSVLVPSALAGPAMAPTVRLAVRRLKRRWGFAIGLLPIIVGFVSCSYLYPKTVDAAAGWLALSLWLAAPNAAGGAILDIISAPRDQRSTAVA